MRRLLAFLIAASTLVYADEATAESHPATGACAPCAGDVVINCAHRGTGVNDASGSAFPENTAPSFVQAVDEGAEMIELDVVHSSDGVLMVIHDDTVDRTTDGSGCVGDMTQAQLQMLDAGFNTQMASMGVTIPTLSEALAAVSLPFNIEIKINDTAGCPNSNKPQLAADVVSAIEADGRLIVVSSFDAIVLTEVETLNPAIETGFLSTNNNDLDAAEAGGFDAFNLIFFAADEPLIQDAIGRGLKLNVWMLNEPVRMTELIEFGVNMIITDDPDTLAQVQTEYCADYACDDAPPVNDKPASSSDDDGGCNLAPGPQRWSALRWSMPWLLAGLFFLRRRKM